jgi:predicted nucleic acid-binding protein
MAVLTDTNILLRLQQPHHPHCPIARRALDILRTRNQPLVIASQNLIEFWVAATRPFDQNGLGLTVDQAMDEISEIKRLWVLLPDVPLFDEWERLVTSLRVSGKNAHDARLVSAMHAQGIDSILTFNWRDFTRFADITVIDPIPLAQ